MPFVLLQINGEEKKIEERSWMRDQSTKFKRCATPTRIIMGKSNGTPNKQCAPLHHGANVNKEGRQKFTTIAPFYCYHRDDRSFDGRIARSRSAGIQ
jgi:hypothetical protein